MYINRITFNEPQNLTYSKDELRGFNQICSYLEELIFHHLPKKANLGGFGFFHNILNQGNIAEDDIKAYGQIIEFNHKAERFNMNSFLSLKEEERLLFLLDKLQKAITTISKNFPVDINKFTECIEEARATGQTFEQKLRVSKTYKSRKIKVDIIRVIEPSEQRVICRLMDNKNERLQEFVLEKDTNVYNVSYNFRKSSWNGTVLSIFDRFDQERYSIDVNKFIKST